MDDEAFLAYVLNNAPRYDIETLEKIVAGLCSNIASRRWGKPADLKLGSNVEAITFDGSWRHYGTVVGFTPKGCTIEPPDSERTQRISYLKYAIRILDEFEWNRISNAFRKHHAKFEKEYAREREERVSDREEAIRDRDKAMRKPKVMRALNGPVEIYRGAYVHAFHPKNGTHEYGVIVEITPKKFFLSNAESDWEPRIWLNKYEAHLLSEEQWAIVDAELRRRQKEYEAAKEAGRERDLPDYSQVEIPVPHA